VSQIKKKRVKFIQSLALLGAMSAIGAEFPARSPLDPRGHVHIPIGLPDTLDSLKTFVEAEGSFSPGFGTYGIYFWVWDAQRKRLFAPTMDGIPVEHGLADGGLLIPWSKWPAGAVGVRTEVCEVSRLSDSNSLCVVGARVHLTNPGTTAAAVSLYVAVRPLGPAGGAVNGIGFSEVKDTMAVNGFPAIAAQERAQAVGGVTNDTIGEWALRGEMPPEKYPANTNGRCSAALRYDLTLAPGATRTFGFTCPVLPNRWAARHRWDGTNAWAQVDLNQPGATNAGIFQPYPSLRFYRLARAELLFAEATNLWREFTGRISMRLPDSRWADAFAALLSHSALCLNEGAPDVAVANYNVFNRDGVYMANIFQKTGRFELSESALDYFLGHPFNGRVQPEADNPGEILWGLGEHWFFTRNRSWLERIFPSAEKLAAMVRYYRTTPGPHFVGDTRLEYGEAVPLSERKELKPGACDGQHPEFTEAWDIAGLRSAVALARALGKMELAAVWEKLADEFFAKYDRQFGGDLAKGYGSYAVLWPCRLYAFDEGKAFDAFKNFGAQPPAGWRYFPLARAHQGLLAGNRAAAADTLGLHLDHPQMRGWFALDEGGDSGVGGWNHVLTTWPQGAVSKAMPHGWATAEMLLLLRDALIFEDGDKLVLFAGVPAGWFKDPAGMRFDNFPTHFGKCSAGWRLTQSEATLTVSGVASPPGGFSLRIPSGHVATITAGGIAIPVKNGEARFPATARTVVVKWLTP
jgi:hypothetical protein